MWGDTNEPGAVGGGRTVPNVDVALSAAFLGAAAAAVGAVGGLELAAAGGAADEACHKRKQRTIIRTDFCNFYHRYKHTSYN